MSPDSPAAPAPSGGNNSNDASRDEMIGSLGEALAGVNLGSNVHNNTFSFRGEQESGPFDYGTQPNGNGELGWGYHAPEASRNQFARPNNSGGREEASNSPQEHPSTPKRQQRKQSIDLFLSQSPSQMLGNDVFKLSTGNLPGLAMDGNEPDDHSGNLGGFRQPLGQGHSTVSPANFSDQRKRTESPSSGITSSSRSDSPYANVDGSRTIQAYHGKPVADKRQPSFGDDNMNRSHGSQPHLQNLDNGNNQRLQSPYNNNMGGQQNLSNFGSPYEQGKGRNSPQHSQANVPNANANPQQQVLYMAVPTPDGRGQVLQPIQMVQFPGKPFAYVLPGQGGMPGATPMQGAMQPAMQPAMPGLMDGQQPMMMLPTMPMQQQGQPNDLMSGLTSGNGRHNNQNKGVGYLGNSPYGDASGQGLREDYNNPMTQGGMGANNQYMPAMNQAQTTDPALAALYSTPQRPPLDALLGQVRRLSRDQVGCRLVQQALDEEGAMAASLILNEGLPFWGEAMVDPFGNYLFQKILEKITLEERIMLVKSVSTRLVNASLNLHGTRSVQKIVELCALDEDKGEQKEGEESAADILTRALAPAAARLCIDSHGNHVIQRILLKLGHHHSKFVFDAVAESVGDVARHRHGCCVIQRCLDSQPSPPRSHLVRRIVDKSLELMQDAYGNYVVQYVLDVCSDEDVHAVCESVIGKVNLLAIQKFSSNVMEKCLERCTDRVKEHYLQELSEGERIRELMMDPFGNYVVQRALSVATHAQAIRLVEAMKPHLLASAPGTPNGQRNGGVRNTAGGRRIMAKICRRFPNFTLNAAGTREELYGQNKGHHRHQHPNPAMVQAYGQIPPGPMHQPLYNGNPHMVNTGVHQFDQRQPYYDIGDTGYFQQTPHMGHGAYPSF